MVGNLTSDPYRWCPSSEQVFATIGNGNQVKVHHVGHQKVCGLELCG